METLKKFEDLCSADARHSVFHVRDSETGQFRPTSQRDIYDAASGIVLHEGVPEDVRSHFAASLNLLAYSWFCFQFSSTAQFFAYVSVEYALKARFPSTKRPSFASLVRRAIDDGLVTDSGFTIVEAAIPGIGAVHLVPPMFTPADGPYVETLAKLLPSLRNTLAHGVISIHNQGPLSVRICAEFINQLFAAPDSAANHSLQRPASPSAEL